MPDISMCAKEECPIKESCYRYTATPNEFWQSYFAPPFIGTACEYYWPNIKESKYDAKK